MNQLIIALTNFVNQLGFYRLSRKILAIRMRQLDSAPGEAIPIVMTRVRLEVEAGQSPEAIVIINRFWRRLAKEDLSPLFKSDQEIAFGAAVLLDFTSEILASHRVSKMGLTVANQLISQFNLELDYADLDQHPSYETFRGLSQQVISSQGYVP